MKRDITDRMELADEMICDDCGEKCRRSASGLCDACEDYIKESAIFHEEGQCE